jgi:hypothetical protein
MVNSHFLQLLFNAALTLTLLATALTLLADFQEHVPAIVLLGGSSVALSILILQLLTAKFSTDPVFDV